MKCCVCIKNRKLYPLLGECASMVCRDCLRELEVCCVCHEQIGTLQLEDGHWECEDCAQVMLERGDDI